MSSKFEIALSDDGETPYFLNTQSSDFRKGLFAIQLPMFRGRVYLHFQSEYFYLILNSKWMNDDDILTINAPRLLSSVDADGLIIYEVY
jgi:hypothetical protein